MGLLSRLFGGGGDDRSPPTERPADKADRADKAGTPHPHEPAALSPERHHALTWPSAGVPQEVHAAVDLRLRIPMRPGLRSLNVAMAAALVSGEALRQTGGFAATPTAADRVSGQ